MNHRFHFAAPLFNGLAALTLTFASMVATAQPAAWPNKPIKLIVPYGAGSSPDVMARIVSDKLAARLGQPVIVENRIGAGGSPQQRDRPPRPQARQPVPRPRRNDRFG